MNSSRYVFTSLLVSVFAIGAWRQPQDVNKQIVKLADAGKLDEAERMARAGGVATSARLGEVLVLRGRLAAADSAYRLSISTNSPGQRTAQVGLAELAWRHGDRTNALGRAVKLTLAYEAGSSRWSADDRVAAGRAYVLLGVSSKQAVHDALAAFDNAAIADASNLEGRLRAADLLLDKYNVADAKGSYDDVLKIAPDNARALLGLARVADFGGKTDAIELVRKSVNANPSLAEAQQLLARFHLEAEEYDSTKVAIRRALAIDSSAMTAWALLGAEAWLTGDSVEYRRARVAAERLNPQPSEFYAEIAEAAVRQRRYADGVRLAQKALELDTLSTRALGLLGTNQLREAKIEQGRATLERAFAIDPFNLWHKNTLDLLDQLRTFQTTDRGHFRFVTPPRETDLLVLYLAPLLQEAYDTLAVRYKYRPPTTVRLEVYRQHADFSVRTVGLAGLGALGVSFGPVLAMDSPAARERGSFNWGATAWHELAHTFTLGSSDNRVPRWLSEGLSVVEERRARPEWGFDVSEDFLQSYVDGKLRPVSELNDGFVRPRFEQETIYSYYLASLVCEMIESQKGAAGIVNMLSAYREGLETPAVIQRVMGLKPEEMDQRFDAYVRKRFEVPLRFIVKSADKPAIPGGLLVSPIRATGAMPNAFEKAMVLGNMHIKTGNVDSARIQFLKAQQLFPEYAGPDAPAWFLAKIERDRGNLRGAVDQLALITSQNATAWDANMLEATLRGQLADTVGQMRALTRVIWISPYDPAVHVTLAQLSARKGDFKTAIRERRAVIALDPADKLDARYELAKALSDAGDIAAARKELLAILEQAPSFEKAQTLLLELSKRGKPGGAQ